MAEDTITPAAPAAAPVNTPALAANPEPPAGDGTETISLEDARKLRSESVNLRKRLKTFEDAEEAKRLAELDGVERSKAEIAKAEKRTLEAEERIKHYQQQLATAQVKLAAQSRGIIDPEIAALAIASKLEYDESGLPTNIEKALDDLVKAHPVFKPADPQQPAPDVAPSAQPENRPGTPALPAMNPGRTAIAAPNTLTPGKPVRLSDIQWSR